MSSHSSQLHLNSPDQTCHLARKIGPLLGPGDTILLAGGVGAGKTHFARCLIQSRLSEPEDVPSPTFTLVQTYDTDAGDIWHADLYRLSDLSEIDELGLTQAFADAICLIEWPDRLGTEAPASALTLHLETQHGDDTRMATFTWTDPSWGDRLKMVFDE